MISSADWHLIFLTDLNVRCHYQMWCKIFAGLNRHYLFRGREDPKKLVSQVIRGLHKREEPFLYGHSKLAGRGRGLFCRMFWFLCQGYMF